MRFKVFIFCCILVLAHTDLVTLDSIPIGLSRGNLTDIRIIGSHEAINGQFPYLVSLQCGNLESSEHFCAGSIIDSSWILTAAHCCFVCPKNYLIVRAGKHYVNAIEPYEQTIKVQKIIVHELYQRNIHLSPDDVALLKLERPLMTNARVRSINLPIPFSEPSGNAVLAGWGAVNPKETVFPNELRTIDLPIISRKLCRASIYAISHSYSLVSRLRETHLCTGPLAGGVSHCRGDSGGSLTTIMNGIEELVGIVSWGFKHCGRKGAPSIYAKVANYVYWMLDKINRN